MPKHTPGPWEVMKGGRLVYGPGRNKVVASTHFNASTKEENIANARIMAASLQLLEAAEEALQEIEQVANDLSGVGIQAQERTRTPIERKLRAAIAKAKPEKKRTPTPQVAPLSGMSPLGLKEGE